MISIGNDIVALRAIDPVRSREPRFYKKILSGQEHELYHRSGYSLEVFVWLIWSVKEAAYKYSKRINNAQQFVPRHIHVLELNVPVAPMGKTEGRNLTEWELEEIAYSCHGTVMIGDQLLDYRSLITDKFIYTITVQPNGEERIFCGLQSIASSEPIDQSLKLRQLALAKLRHVLPRQHFQIEKSVAGYPFLSGENISPVVLSFSHHDKWIAYAFAR